MKKVLLCLIFSLLANGETIQTASTEMIPSPIGQFIDNNRATNKVSVVFYRLNGDSNCIPSVKAGDDIVGSLPPNHYATTQVCKNRLLLGVAARGDIINPTYNNLGTIENVTDTIYVKINETKNDSRFSLSLVDPNIAKNEISSLQMQSNIINRHTPQCEEVKEAPKVLETITICAHALFDFDSSKLRPEAASELNIAIEKIKRYGVAVKGVNITGYTDRLGSEQHNLILSHKRAQSVVEYLILHSSLKNINGRGLGKENPVSIGCEKYSGSQLKACLQPDRRVVIELMTN